MDPEVYRAVLAQVKQEIVSDAAEQVALRKVRRQRKLEYRRVQEHTPEETAAYRSFFSKTDAKRVWRSRAIRYQLLAYAYLRGRPYAHAEAHCHEQNRPRAGALYQLLSRIMCLPEQEAMPRLEDWLAGLQASPYTRPPRQPQISAPIE